MQTTARKWSLDPPSGNVSIYTFIRLPGCQQILSFCGYIGEAGLTTMGIASEIYSSITSPPHAFATDGTIVSKKKFESAPNSVPPRQLEAWKADIGQESGQDVDLQHERTGSWGAAKMYATHLRKYSSKVNSTYDELIYTSKIDTTCKDFAQRERRAEALAKTIEGSKISRGTDLSEAERYSDVDPYQRREQVQLKNHRPMALSGATLSSAAIIILYYPNYTFIHKTHLLYTVEIIQNLADTRCHSPLSDDMHETSAASVALPAASVTLPPKHAPAALPSQTPVISQSPVVRTPTSRFTVTTLAVATPVLSPSQTSSRPLSYSMIYWYSTPRLVVASGTNIPFFLYGVLFQ